MTAPTIVPPMTRWKVTVGDYHRMAAAGYFAGSRVELIEGEIVELNALGGQHIRCVAILSRWLDRAVGDDLFVSAQSSIRLNDRSEPEPDIVVLSALPEGAAPPSPEDVLLVVEVSDTSLAADRDVKAPLYAQARIPLMLLVDLQQATVSLYAQPGADGYRTRTTYGAGERLVFNLEKSITIDINVDSLFA